MIQKIFILWASWNVWRELVKQVVEKDWIKNHINPTKIIWVASSSSYIFNSEWINENILNNISYSRENAVKEFSENSTKFEKLQNLVDLVKQNWLDWEVVFVDVTAGKEELLAFHKYVIWNSNNFLVTANKNPISLFSGEDFDLLTSYSGRYNTNTTVMWGAGVLDFVNERTNKIVDNISRIEWVFSGTLGYILSELSLWEKSFSVIVKEAKEQWYTEPNPWDDLNWLDVARKMIILARYSGHKVDISDVIVEPLIAEKYWKLEWDKFLDEIKNEDSRFLELLTKSLKNNEVLSYVWEMNFDKQKNKLELKVWLKSVPKNSDLWGLSWTANLAIVETEILQNPIPHTIKSRWAGLAVTAWAVRVWIAKMLPNNITSK
jgi:aspartokinase/homoserine dehydrogenase 1